ncbi:hypothetical protein X275_04230 [Marinitoga sp. 1197]|uniref:hypothetical protein n=1 Tax=Marinitoga sp. 1197 TaxID=1428449 RepID=UPI000640DE05|nr:hypothetical protein [Marinitoga sp. 1197]KLO22991.1 hypothetical protein X275_04230 [Marinitoga sp. 1197]
MKKFLVVFFMFLIALISYGEMIYNFSQKAYEKETKYFKFVFEKDLYLYYDELKNVSDKLYEDYSGFYDTKPGSITVFIFDDVDFVNAFAVPQINIIRLYINSPQAKMGLSTNVENWIPFVFSHELNHIFYGNMTNKYISWIPDNIIKKILISSWEPSYLHEGLSIYMESKYFKGRFQNDLFNMYLKAEILSKEYPRYSLGSGASKDIWSPAGFNYMYGAIFTKEISEKYGEDKLREIIKDINSHLFFSTISTSFERVTDEKWNDFLLYIKVKYKNEYIELLNKGYDSDYKALDDSYHYTSNLKTDGNYLYYYKQSPGKRSGVYKGNKLILPDIRNFDISDDGKITYITQIENMNLLYLKCDCPISDTLIDKRVKTFKFIDNNRIVYTKINNGLTAIFIWDLRDSKIRKVLDWGKYIVNDFYYSNNKIYFSGNINNQNDIYYIDLNNYDLIQVTNDKYTEMNIFIKNNKLYYTANYEDNIFNIYSLNLKTKKLTKLTNHIYGVFYPVVLNENLYFLYYNEEGYHLSRIKNSDLAKESKIFIYKPQKKELDNYNKNFKINNVNKYKEELKYGILFPYIENDDVGVIYAAISEGINYGIGGGILTDFNEIIPVVGVYLDYYTQNFAKFKYLNNNIYSEINISKNFEFYLKKKNYLNINIFFQLENSKFLSKDIQISLTKSPYTINSQNYYENNILFGYKDNNYYIQTSTAFDIKTLKIEPYVYYDTIGNMILGTNISKKLWNQYFSILDGKYGFDGIRISGGYGYNLSSKKSLWKLSIITDFTALYWLNIPVPIFNK